ncbi:GMC family oxidoreductase [Halobacteriales archaeon SW_7_68_16]|nr:MAG: GMC family oxidoreductase [Halobacteriales archaeon SW_7_68_16]
MTGHSVDRTPIEGDDVDRTPVEGADVCVVGAGPAGAILSHSLARRGHEVVVLEAGPRFDMESRIDRMKRQIRPDASVEEIWDMGGERDAYTTSGVQSWPLNKRRVKGVGGTSLHWGGVTPRFHPKDFEMESRYGVARDWPIGYEDLRPYYVRAEAEIGVAGDESAEHIAPRDEPYPMDAFEPSYTDQLFAQAGEELGIDIHSIPLAYNDGTYERNECEGYGTCQYVCPNGAKYSADVHVEKAEEEGATVVDRAPVQRLEHGPDGQQVTGAVYETPDGESHRQEADVFVAAAGAYETPRLLFLSESDHYPDGLANSSGTLGKYFMGHPPAAVFGILPDQETYQGVNGVALSSCTYQFYEDESGERGSINIMFSSTAGPSPAEIALRSDATGDDLLETVDGQFGNALGMTIAVEMLPRADNRITLDDSRTDDRGNPVLDLQMEPGAFARRAQERAIEVGTDLIEELGGTVIYGEGTMTSTHDDLSASAQGGYHPMGGTRMGTDPEKSVVDPTLRTHDLDNLYVSGGGVFVTSGAANPTLTVMALSLKAADHIDERL